MSKSKPKSKFQFWQQTQNQCSDFTSNFNEIRLKFCRNFDFVKSKQSKSKPTSKLQFYRQNSDFDFKIEIDISENKNIEILTK
jgi:hypothetical protein